MDCILLSGGKVDPPPFKSLILLKIRNKYKISDTTIHKPLTCVEVQGRDFYKVTHKSVKLVKEEIDEGIGPEREQPCMCL